jgi:ParB family chromosome partitioning protein
MDPPAGHRGYAALAIVAGRASRSRAARAAGLEQVEVIIRETEDERVRRQKSVISNVQREDVGPIEMAEALQSLMNDDDRVTSQDDLAKLIGKDKAWISGMLRVLTLPAALKQKIASSELAISYDTMIRIARLDDPVPQEQLVNAVIHGATVREVRQHIVTIKTATATGTRPSAPKPKRIFHTTYKASVIVQATGARLTTDQCVMALKAAVQQALEAALDDDNSA